MTNLLNKAKPSYREIRPMRGRLMRGLPVYLMILNLFPFIHDLSTKRKKIEFLVVP